MKILFYFLSILCLTSSCKTEEPPMPPPNTKPSVSIDALSVEEGDQANSVFINVHLTKASTESVTISVESENGSAKAGSDYVAVSESIEFGVGSVQETVKLDILGDDDKESDEDLKINIVNVTGASLGNASATIIIQNDDEGEPGTLEYEGWTKLWSDEFDGEQLDESFWTYEIGNGDWGWGNNELEYYKKENTSIIDGHLVIEAKKEDQFGFDYTSSRIKTQDKFEDKGYGPLCGCWEKILTILSSNGQDVEKLTSWK